MTISKEGERYIARTIPAEKDLPKRAGFRWDPDRRVWWTRYIDCAMKLAAYADDSCKSELTAAAQLHQESLDASRASDTDVEIPITEGHSYRPFQRAGINYALKRFAAGQKSVLIADDPGLGKTIQAIGIFNALPEIKRVLIVCPATLKINWQREWMRFAVRKCAVAIANGTFPSADVVIINYDILEKHHDAIRQTQWDLLIVDESHYLKNEKAKRTQEVFGHEKWDKVKRVATITVAPIPCERSVFMTGTPIVNRPIELWPFLHYADPTNWRSFMGFGKRYTNAYYNGYGWDFTGAAHLDELQDRLRSTLMVRRLKSEVLSELPAKQRQIIELPANGARAAVEAEQQVTQRQQEMSDALEALEELGAEMGWEKTSRPCDDEVR